MCVSWMPRASFSNFVNASGSVLLFRIEVMMPHPGINLNLTRSSQLVKIPAQDVTIQFQMSVSVPLRAWELPLQKVHLQALNNYFQDF